ncbi:hypothetical protein BV898_01289 [Hypsibius exemplaris]|uniref:Tetraspanin n=1 Tax=Hypsibius exemplaris TaxID=2072580 RepID=A0A1W0XCT5_HYPEX|nr:hypothetical protein BV898_01289 [Hypsibius exemplaris]
MCWKRLTGVHRYKYSMRNFTTLEWGLIVVCTLQLFSGISLLVVNSILVAVEDVLIWGYYRSESIFGKSPEYNYTLVTCALYVLGLTLFCCGAFGLCGILMWRYRGTFIILYIFSALVSLSCIGVVLYVIFDVVGHQMNRIEGYEREYSTIVFNGPHEDQEKRGYLYDEKKRQHFDQVQRDIRCCGYISPMDWLQRSPTGYIPPSCCRFTEDETGKCRHLGVRLDGVTNATQLSLAEAWDEGCFVKLEEREHTVNVLAYIFYGCITSAGIILQLIGLILAVLYKLTNFSVIMRPTYSTHL